MGGITYDRLSLVFNKLRPKGVNTAPWMFYSEKGTPFGVLKMPRPLDIAIRNSDIKEVETLLDKGADPNLVTHFSGPAIKEAARTADIDIVKLVHSRGADLNGTDTAGGTALHAAVSDTYGFNAQKKLEILQYLLDNGARTDLRNSCDMTPLEWARRLGNAEAETLIAKHLGFDTCAELAPAKQPDGTYVFPVNAGEPGSLRASIAGLRDIYALCDVETRQIPALVLTAKAAHLAENAFGLGKCAISIRETGKEAAVDQLSFGGSYELVLVPEAVLKRRAQAAADEKAAFNDKLDKGLPTEGKVKGLKPISFKKPSP